ncbi:hypothetical protein M3N64_06510 [Sporolactobacillus sp. CPB3-1]|uniref:ABC-2 type transporter domain-containing protein n=1 Tax=Sporolactobacillus mangiferae TaxID=2940498 RepID=A0ABT0MB78_9BACL|nr:hypothetical protein [Sporolactobacillus mangiferae]MCL1631600.1 hypothetical protein [Sporolactobacillus mangiferae]
MNLKIIYNYFKVFNKIIWSEKIPFIYTLVAPALFFVFSNFSLYGEKHIDGSHLVLKGANYFGYIIVSVMVNGISLQLLNFRENGSLKTFTMISGGNKHLVISGLIVSELFFGLICSTIFSTLVSTFDFHSFFFILLTSLFIYLISGIPIAFLVLFMAVLKVRANTMGTVSNLLVILFIWIAAVRRDTGNFLGEYLYGLIPNDYVTQVVIFIVRSFQGTFSLSGLYILIAVTVTYIVIGTWSLSKIQINSIYMRN